MAHRIREAMRDGGLAPLGGDGGSSKPTKPISASCRSRSASKQRSGRPYTSAASTVRQQACHRRRLSSAAVACARSMSPIADEATVAQDRAREHRPRERACTPTKASLYIKVGAEFAAHETVKHSAKEYARGDVHTNISRRLLLNLQARHARHLSALRREAFAPLSCRIRFPLQSPRQAWLQRWRTCRACREGCGWQASHVSGASLSPNSNSR